MRPHEQLERDWGEWADVPNVVACSSGTAALHLALEALQLPLGSYCLVPDYAMIACARAVTLAGLIPVFVDCDERGLVDPALVAKAIADSPERLTPQVILAVHTYGRRCDMEALYGIAREHRLLVVEDLAEAHGLAPHGASVASCWSMYRNKIVAGEEGGAVSFIDPTRARLARQLRNVGFTPAHDYTHVPRGCNYRLADCLAEKVLGSLGRVEENLRERRRAERLYDEACPLAWRVTSPRDAPWVYDLLVPALTTEDQTLAITALRARGIEARHGFKPLSSQEEYAGSPRFSTRLATVSQRLAREIIYLPLTPGVVSAEYVTLAFASLRAALAAYLR